MCTTRAHKHAHSLPFPAVEAPTPSTYDGTMHHLVRSFLRSFVRLFVRPSVRLFVRSFVCQFVRSFVRSLGLGTTPHRPESPTFRGHGGRALSRADYVAARSTGVARYELKDAPFPRVHTRVYGRGRDREFQPIMQKFQPCSLVILLPSLPPAALHSDLDVVFGS